MNVIRILHASVNVHGQAEETGRWYEEVLGLASAQRPEIPGVPGRWFRVGSGQVHLVGAPPAGAGIDPTGPHYCLAVDDIDAAIGELESRGIVYLRAAQGDVTQIWVADPAGNTIELQPDRPL